MQGWQKKRQLNPEDVLVYTTNCPVILYWTMFEETKTESMLQYYVLNEDTTLV